MSRKSSRQSSEAGSAYIIALLILVILTIVGLALTLVTQTEVSLGANERSITRTFYASDSGAAVSLASVLVTGDYKGQSFKIPGDSTLATFEDQVSVTPILPILDAPCNLCQINTGSEFYDITHAANSQDGRVGKSGGTDLPLASKRVGWMVALQPWQHSTDSLAISATDLARISF